MGHDVEYIIGLADRMSAPLKNISATVVAFGNKVKEIKTASTATFDKFRTEVNKVAASTNKLPSSLFDIKEKLRDLNGQLDNTHSKQSFVNLKKEVEATNKELHKMENLPPQSFISKIKALPEQFGLSFKALAGMFAATEIISFGKESVKAFDEEAKAAAQLTAGLISTRQSSGRTFEELKKQAEDLENKTLFKHDITMKAQGQLMVFSKVHGKVFDDAIVAAQNLATKFSIDLPEATKMVGKALQDPEHGMRLLRMAGINFTTEQVKHIKELIKHGDLQKVQLSILTGMQNSFGGAAEAAAKAGLGPMQQLEMQWNHVREGVGQLIVSLMVKLKPTLELIVRGIQSLTEFFIHHRWVLMSIITAVGILATAWAGTRLVMMFAASTMWTQVIPAIVAVGKAIFAIPIIGWIAVAIAAIITVVMILYNYSAKTRGILFGVWAAVKAIFSNIGSFIGDVFKGVWTIIKAVFNPLNWFSKESKIDEGLKQIAEAAKKYGRAVSKGFDDGKKEGEHDYVNDQYKDEADKLGLSMAEYKKAKEGARAKKMSVEDYVKSGFNVTEPGGVTDKNKKTDNTIDPSEDIKGIASGGSKAINITVNFGKLVEQFIVHAHGLKEGMNEIENQGTEALLRVLNGANKLATKQ